MVADAAIPWYNLSPRKFPAKRWQEERYPFQVPASVFIRPLAAPPLPEHGEPRRFPDLGWLGQQQAGG